ncbi:hypothetical protein Tco_0079710 [Tanacetum coccineum]
MVVLVGENIVALKNVIEDEPYFIMEVLMAKVVVAKVKEVVLWREGAMVGGVEKISSTGSKLIANKEDCLDGCDGADGGVVNGGGVVLGNTLKKMVEGMFGKRSNFLKSTDQPVPSVPSTGWNRPLILKGTGCLQNAGSKTVLRKTKSSSVCLYENNMEVRLSRLKRKYDYEITQCLLDLM